MCSSVGAVAARLGVPSAITPIAIQAALIRRIAFSPFATLTLRPPTRLAETPRSERGASVKLRILGGADIKALLPMADCIDLMQTTMIAVSEGRARIPLRTVLPVGAGLLGNMPGYLAEPECFGIKLLSLF